MGRGLTFCLGYDAGPGVGLGHQRRMQALAAALAALDESTRLVELDEPGRDVSLEADVVVVDSYRHRADADGVRAGVRVAVDDLLRDLDVDVLVDPSPPPTRTDRALPDAPVVLRGLEYALLDPALGRRPTRAVREPVETVLVATGGSDQGGIGAGIAATLLQKTSDVRIRLVVGPWSARDVPPGVEAVAAPDGLTAELEAADVVLCSAGVTLLESLALGRPTVAFVTVPGQERALAGCEAGGAAVSARSVDAPARARELIDDPDRRRRLSRAGRRCIDGRGATRVAEVLRDRG